MRKRLRDCLEHLASANKGVNPDLVRLALKLATACGEDNRHGDVDLMAGNQRCAPSTKRQHSADSLVNRRFSAIRKNRSDQRIVRLRFGLYMTITEQQSTRQDHREGVLAKTIEEQTAKLPSDTFLWLALGSIATSLTLKVSGRHQDALFVGQWAPTFLLLGVYNKLVKQLGSDRQENGV
jgi:hypothetical protein